MSRSTFVIFGRPVFVILGAAEIRQKIGVPPSYDAPAIVTAPVPAAINHGIDRRAAADDPSPGIPD
jgi:hypothetical protein